MMFLVMQPRAGLQPKWPCSKGQGHRPEGAAAPEKNAEPELQGSSVQDGHAAEYAVVREMPRPWPSSGQAGGQNCSAVAVRLL